MTDFILDCSVAMSWCFADEGGSYSEDILDALIDSTAIVPPLWQYEVCNVLIFSEKKKRLSKRDSIHFLDILSHLPIVEDDTKTNSSEILNLARLHNLSAYDSAYLELAIRKGLPIASLDKSLVKAAISEGLKIFKT